jgi:predicted site-specific integrase-resolvase
LTSVKTFRIKLGVSPRSYTTIAAAEKIGVTRATLQQWIKDGKVRPPKIQPRAGKPPVRLWDDSDIARLRKLREEMQAKMRIGRPKKRA